MISDRDAYGYLLVFFAGLLVGFYLGLWRYETPGPEKCMGKCMYKGFEAGVYSEDFLFDKRRCKCVSYDHMEVWEVEE